MKPQELLKFLIAKIKSGELKAINEHWKRKYVEMHELQNYNGVAIDEEKSSIDPYKLPKDWRDKSLEDDGFVITLVISYDNVHWIPKKFTTWYNGKHRGYGDTIIVDGWNCTPYLNFDNNGNEIEIKEKTLMEQFASPQLKYYKP